MASQLPDVELPRPMGKLPEFIQQNPKTPVVDIIDPYVKYEARLRQLYAQNPDHALVKDPHANVLSLFAEGTPPIKTRARDLASDSKEEKDRYIMALPDEKRRPTGSPAVVSSLREFQDNFAVFSESAIVDLDWSNVVASGSSVVNCLLPVPKEFKSSKRALREYYHEKFCPASDVDLFIYGITEEQAVEKIKQIETRVRDSILTEVTTVRTKNAITICSQYPTRHIQIVLRIYKNVSEILTGFDIDCSGAAYDGSQVYITPRALGSFITQINHIDLTRRSPSYENRLSKYSHRNFEVYWPDLERSRIDPTIFERSFQRTLGLARLLVLEQLPTPYAREQYSDTRRKERGRPVKYRGFSYRHLTGNLKESHEDEVAEWVTEDEVSNYHTFTLPYGPKYHAKKIEKLCYTRDLLLNAEWNKPKDREVHLHRHPAFFGRVRDIIKDCCGSCPAPKTQEEREVLEEESKIYISGNITFMKDDPGRQAIGSFNPLTDDDWTDMAYVGNTTRLCQAIADGDLETVKEWFTQDGADPNRRDHTGRTPLHLAVMSSTKEIVQCLVDNGARLVARVADGRTALHLAAQRGDAQIVKIVMDKSTVNEETEQEKMEKRRQAKTTNSGSLKNGSADGITGAKTDSDDSDGELIDAEDSDDDNHSMATGSFVKVKKDDKKGDDIVPDDAKDEPDYYDVDVVAWDSPVSALHLAILSGNTSIVKVLCDQYGADQILPIKFLDDYDKKPTKAILTLALALTLPKKKAKEMAEALVSLGASCSQADMHGVTSFHRYIRFAPAELVETLWEKDQLGAKAALNYLAIQRGRWSWHNSPCVSPLVSAIEAENTQVILKLLGAGAEPEVKFESWLAAAKGLGDKSFLESDMEANKKKYLKSTTQPLIKALECDDLSIATNLVEVGVDVNVLTTNTYDVMNSYSYRKSTTRGYSALDVVQDKIKGLEQHTGDGPIPRPVAKVGMDDFLKQFAEGTYQHLMVSREIGATMRAEKVAAQRYEEDVKEKERIVGVKEKEAAIKARLSELRQLEKLMVSKGAKAYPQLYPDNQLKSPEEEQKAVHEVKAQSNMFKYDFKFNSRDLTDTRKEGYIQLFEACWSGDVDKIKSLTAMPWGEGERKEPPLEISVSDNVGNNPFSLSFCRGHYDAARTVLEIVQAQYSPKEKEETRYTMESDNESYDSYEDSDVNSECESEPRVVERTVDAKFTIDNVGEVSMTVKSHTKPLQMLELYFPTVEFKEGMVVAPDTIRPTVTPILHCLKYNNGQALKFLLDVGAEFASRKLPGEENDEGGTQFTITHAEYQAAIACDHPELLGEIIRRTGAGMPLEHLITKSGVEMKKKARYYQGLTVYGKKRADWAAAGRGTVSRQTGDKNPPLLYAALNGCIGSVEWYLSDTPARKYLEWCNSKAARDDARLKHLRQSGGYEAAIEQWLGAGNNQVLHCAVMGPTTDESLDKTNELIKYLVKACPETLEVKTSGQRYTPLAIAFRLGRYKFAKTLIEAGADQTVKTGDFNNLMHLVLESSPLAGPLRQMLELLDPELRGEMMAQRNKLSVAGASPLHRWVQGIQYNSHGYRTKQEAAEVFKLLLEMGSPSLKELHMFNGPGDTVMHTLVMNGQRHLVAILVEHNSSLLYRENAVGRTPVEISEDRYLQQVLNKHMLGGANSITQLRHGLGMTQVQSKFFVKYPKTGAPPPSASGSQNKNSSDLMWRALRDCQAKYPVAPRRLVSLYEANDVANRISNKYVGYRWNSLVSRFKDDDNTEDGDKEEDTKDKDEKEKKNEKDEEASRFHYTESMLTPRLNTAWAEFKSKTNQTWVCNDCGEKHHYGGKACDLAKDEEEYDSDEN
ncbi:ankyrin repeat protein [Zalerion maritima]|uniref:Ankyrin repeat protein n=1 Tax=Zalerion maritima TaxID=339359 RepID=A0AAD5S032_9PEZI|nr:ankyrin repeat protein [Zalerion maritima]